MTAKDRYRKLCLEDTTIPIFSKDWWMDATCGDEWDVLLVERDNKIVASMPIYIKKKFGIPYITHPKLTQTQGLHIQYPENQPYTRRLWFEKEVMNEAIEQLEARKVAYFQQNFHYSFQNWQPFYWKGFNQTTRYTSVFSDLSNPEELFSAFSRNTRRKINKASRSAIVKETEDLELFHHLLTRVYDRQGKQTNTSFEYIQRLDNACKEHDSRVMLAAQDSKGMEHSIVYIVWDAESAYLLMSGTEPKTRTNDYKTLLVWEAIKFASKVTKKFDFEGSMMENVAEYNRSFGAPLMPYYSISKAIKFKLGFELYKALR